MTALSAAAQPRGTATVSGYITDQGSAAYGYYTLTIPRGKVSLQYSYVGYESQAIELDLRRDTTISIALRPSAEIREATVVAQKDAGIQSTYLGSIDIPLVHIQRTPVVFGEADVLKAIQLMPGVQGGNEGFTGLYVRGGGPDENLILLDGVPIYNVDHMLGILSVFQTEAVKKVTLYKGSFPARYGGRVSSIVDIRDGEVPSGGADHQGQAQLFDQRPRPAHDLLRPDYPLLWKEVRRRERCLCQLFLLRPERQDLLASDREGPLLPGLV